MTFKASNSSKDSLDDDLVSLGFYSNAIVRINVTEEGVNDEDEIVLDAGLVQDNEIDDTSEYQANNMPSAPTGFEIMERPPKMSRCFVNHES